MRKIVVLFFMLYAVIASAQNYDVAITEIIRPIGYYSVNESLQYPYVVIENVGDITITEVDVYYRIDDGEPVMRHVAPIELQTGETRNVLFLEVDLPIGSHEFTTWVALADGFEDLNLDNNELTSEFFVTGGNISLVAVEEPIGYYCGFDSLAPSVWVKNVAEIVVENFSAKYRIDMDPMVEILWQGELLPNDSVLVSFPLMNPGNGAHSIQFFAIEPNGAPDFETSNNAIGNEFEFYLGQHVSIEIQTDWDGNENSFVLYNSADEVIATEDGFSDQNNYVFDYCLMPGCYNFIIYDSGHDGMCHNQSQGYYSINNEDTGEGYGTACDFGSQDEVFFCIAPPDGPPIPFFSVQVINSCSGEVQFNDLSSSATSITSYIWDFGDGTTSAEQNPLHHYNGSGTYSVSLYVSNQNGTENYTVFNAVTVDMPDAPEVNDGFSCGPGDVNVSVEANGDNIDWFDDMNAMSPVFTGNAYTFNNLTETTTWYVQETLAPEIEYVGMFDNEGPGGYFNFNIWRSVSITAHQDLTIKSIKFFADGGGQRIIYVYDDGGNLLTQYTVGIPNGEHRIDVNIPLPEGNYLFYVNQQNNLAFTGDYGGPDVGYPFSVDGLISITGNNYSNSFFYFFYDIEVFAGYSEFCLTPKVPVTAYVLYPHPELDDVTNCCSGQACWLDAGANFDEYLWSTSQTDQEIEASQGNYTVSVTDSFGCTGEGSTEVVVNAMGDLSLTIEHVTVFGANDGSIVAEVIGGTPPYSFAWSNGETTPEINGLEPGTYTLTIIDASGCLYVDTVVVQLLSSIDSWSSEVKIYPNPIITSCIVEFPNEKINISLYNSLGVLLYAVKDAQDIAQINMSELPLGFYILEINSARGSLTRRLIKQ